MSADLRNVFTSNEYVGIANAFAIENAVWPNRLIASAPEFRAKHFRAILTSRRSHGGDFSVSAPGLQYLKARLDRGDGPKECYVVLFEKDKTGDEQFINCLCLEQLLLLIGDEPPREPNQKDYPPHWWVREDFTVARHKQFAESV